MLIVVGRNGRGRAWSYQDLRAARLCPITQLDDLVLQSVDDLVASESRRDLPELVRHLPEGPVRDRIHLALRDWASEDSPSRRELGMQAVARIWEHLTKHASRPPKQAEQIVAIIAEDRLAREGQVSRVRASSESALASSGSRTATPSSRRNTETMSETEAKTRAARIPDNAVIRLSSDKDGKQYGADHNPKRAGSKAAQRFALYRDGMTVAEAKAAGLTAPDIAYDRDPARGLISLEVPASSEAS